LGQVGHIEDIAVAKDQQGKKLGLRIIQALDHVAEKVGCYKVCLFLPGDSFWCSSANVTFATDNSRLLRGQRGLLCKVWL
jgi:GNAT superfamily N-acetyltransferase